VPRCLKGASDCPPRPPIELCPAHVCGP
jgi:hypothetical protein